MVNSLELKGAIVAKGYTYDQVASKIGISRTSFGKKINNIVDFTLKEVIRLKIVLELNNEQFHKIFFSGV